MILCIILEVQHAIVLGQGNDGMRELVQQSLDEGSSVTFKNHALAHLRKAGNHHVKLSVAWFEE